MTNLVHYIYTSAATHPLGNAEIATLLESARTNNHKLGVTGILLYIQGTFFQVLEGERDVVEELFAKIAGDPRHTKVTTIICESIPKRSFGEWTMSYASVSEEELDTILDTLFRQFCIGK